MKRKILVVLGLVAFLGVGLTGYTTAVEESVEATVTVLDIAVSITDPAPAGIDYGIVTTNEVDSLPSPDDILVANNDGNVEEDFFIKGTDTTDGGGTAWSLITGSPAGNSYNHKFGLWTGSLGTLVPFGTSNTEFKADVATSGSQQFKLRLSTPTSSTGTDPRTMDVVIVVVESTGGGF